MRKSAVKSFPVAIIGGGPVGLAAAAHLVSRGIPVKLYEAGSAVGANIRDWGHVRIFTPWRYCVDAASVALLERRGWKAPPADTFPTGNDLVRNYLEPLSATPELAAVIETDARVTAISRLGVDKVVSQGREGQPFILAVTTATGTRRDLARAVLDASGTWATPNPLGASGIMASGEREHADRIAYAIPDVLGRHHTIYARQTTLVVGAGHSAANALLDLTLMAEADPATKVIWATRRANLVNIYGGGDADQLPARSELGAGTRALVEGGRVPLVADFAIFAIREEGGGLMIDGMTGDGPRTIGPVDRIIAATGQRPDLSLTRELRVDLDPWLESTKALGPLIDPNEHSCGSVPAHGHRELAHLESGFYTVGIKSYGRAPTFLMLTGYEQVRSVAAALAGDLREADNVQLVLPGTGVCVTKFNVGGGEIAGCCGSPAPKRGGVSSGAIVWSRTKLGGSATAELPHKHRNRRCSC